MLLDTLANSAFYSRIHPGFAAAFEYLRTAQLSALPAGRHDIDGERLFVMLNLGSGRGTQGARSEAHRRYIDIQLTVAGNELIGWSPLTECRLVDLPYDSTKDVVLFSDAPKLWCPVPPGVFAVFFPEDVHAPMAADPEVELRKAVVKVAVDWQ